MRHKNLDQLELIGKLLDLPIEESWEHGARYKLNDFQEVFVRLMGAGGGKGYASISPRSSYRRGYDSPSFHHDHSTISINFAEGKAPEKIAQDVKRRLLNSPDLEEVTRYTIRQVEAHKRAKTKEAEMAQKLEAVGVERIGEGKAYYNSNGLYMDMRIEGGDFYFDRFSIDRAKAAEVIEAIIKIHAKN